MKMRLIAILFSAITVLTACSNDGGITAKPGTLTVTVVDGSASPATPIASAHILVFDTSTGNPIDTLTSDAAGSASADYYERNVQLKVSAQGYSASPPSGVAPLPITLPADENTPVTVTLYPLDPALALGAISGQVRDHLDKPVAGALVVADDGSTPIATTTDDNGNYLIYNVPAGQVDVTAWMSGYNFPTLSALTVVDGETLADQNISATGVATGSISGHVSFTSISGDVVDITLLLPGSREVLPGLRTYTVAGDTYTLSDVPNGTFEIIASLENDGYVLDPDIAVTQGVPEVTINNDAITKDFKVTGAIELDTPATPVNNVIPVLSATPTFAWHQASSYSNVDYYIVDVVDESGDTVWGGIDPVTMTGPVMIAKQDPISIDYNFDASATLATLEAGRYYQLRLYARKPDVSTPSGYKLVSATETLDGLFRVESP